MVRIKIEKCQNITRAVAVPRPLPILLHGLIEAPDALPLDLLPLDALRLDELASRIEFN